MFILHTGITNTNPHIIRNTTLVPIKTPSFFFNVTIVNPKTSQKHKNEAVNVFHVKRRFIIILLLSIFLHETR